MGARWYDPDLGRWISPDSIVPDPANPQSLNRFSYCLNNSLRLTDPSGHYGKDVHLDLTLETATRIESRVTGMIGLMVRPGEEGRLRATAIARADQFTDENLKTTPVDVIRKVEGDSRTTAEFYHFTSLSEAEGRLQSAVKSKDIGAFGTAMHAYQDYWSHTRKGFSVPIQRAGIDRVQEMCPECSYLYSQDVLEGRARLLGHFPDKWNDLYDPETDVDDVYMRQGVEFWLILFLCELYGVDPEDYWVIYGEVDKPGNRGN
jgi:hypothetical protein